jgi:hypothetical protein
MGSLHDGCAELGKFADEETTAKPIGEEHPASRDLQLPQKPSTVLQKYCTFLTASTTFLLILWLLLDLKYQTPASFSTIQNWTTCGNTILEAVSRGCEFDLLSYTWMPQQCQDHQTASKFREWLYLPERQYGHFPFSQTYWRARDLRTRRRYRKE